MKYGRMHTSMITSEDHSVTGNMFCYCFLFGLRLRCCFMVCLVFAFFVFVVWGFFKETRHLSVCPPVLLKQQLLAGHLVSPVPKENLWSGNPSPDDLLTELCSRSGQSGKKGICVDWASASKHEGQSFCRARRVSRLLKRCPWKVSLWLWFPQVPQLWS